MIFRKIAFIVILVLLQTIQTFAQDNISATIEEAKQFYEQQQYADAAKMLSQALEDVNQKLLAQMESLFPDPIGGWRKNDAMSQIKKSAYSTGLVSKCEYFKNGGGSSLSIEIETNSPRIANLKMAFVNPSLLKQAGAGMKISKVDDRPCIERFDPVDKFAELVFVPGSSVLVTIRGHDMKNTKIVAEFAEKLKWDDVLAMFP